jgi:hypothetical protein
MKKTYPYYWLIASTVLFRHNEPRALAHGLSMMTTTKHSVANRGQISPQLTIAPSRRDTVDVSESQDGFRSRYLRGCSLMWDELKMATNMSRAGFYTSIE